MNVRVDFFAAGWDTAPVVKGLPDDACPCPHWGYVFKGKVLVRYDDHEETLEAGDAYYMAPGHVPLFLEDTEILSVSPVDELRDVLEVVEANTAALERGA